MGTERRGGVMARPMRRYTIFVTLIVTCIVPGVAAQDWIDSFGTDTRYRPPEYVSGYGSSDLPDRGERLEAARSDALSQLSKQVQVQITSDETIRTSDYGDRGTVQYTSTLQTSSDLQITGAEFEVVERRRTTHVLAWIPIERLQQQYRELGADARRQITSLLDRFDESLAAGNLEQAQRLLSRLDTAFTALTDTITVARALDTLAQEPSHTITIDPVAFQTEIESRRENIQLFEPANLQQAADYLARLLREEVGRVERVTPLLYRDADFSSAFGNRLAGLLETSLSAVSTTGDDDVIVRGSYWPAAEYVELQVVARAIETGRTVAAAHTRVPRAAVRGADLKPANMDTALTSGAALLNDQIVNGGLSLEVWTDKGRNERALVFEEGDFVQFYFRVNQPAFLQLSYVLASGDTVLLEENFYIGIDRVNRVVALPYRFRVVPPFGVERLVVTGYSTAPPPPDVVPRVIDGQQYEVFRSVEEAVVRTRGLVREDPPEEAGDTRVAEESLSITTVGRE